MKLIRLAQEEAADYSQIYEQKFYNLIDQISLSEVPAFLDKMGIPFSKSLAADGSHIIRILNYYEATIDASICPEEAALWIIENLYQSIDSEDVARHIFNSIFKRFRKRKLMYYFVEADGQRDIIHFYNEKKQYLFTFRGMAYETYKMNSQFFKKANFWHISAKMCFLSLAMELLS